MNAGLCGEIIPGQAKLSLGRLEVVLLGVFWHRVRVWYSLRTRLTGAAPHVKTLPLPDGRGGFVLWMLRQRLTPFPKRLHRCQWQEMRLRHVGQWDEAVMPVEGCCCAILGIYHKGIGGNLGTDGPLERISQECPS